MAENLAGMLKVQDLTSSTRRGKWGEKKAKEIVVVCPHSLEDILKPQQTAQRSCVEDKAGDRGDSGKTYVFSPRCRACTEESQDSKRRNWGRSGGEGTLPSQAGVLLIRHRSESPGRTVEGQGVSATDMHQGAGWVRGEPSSLATWKAEILGLPDPPSQLSAEEEERKRERLVPQFARVVGAFTW